MKRLAILLIAFNMGCESMQPSEKAWHVLHVVDVAQTLNIVDDTCYRERNGLTRRIIGQEPNEGEVLAWGIVTGIGHYWISRELENRDAPQWLQRTWQATNLVVTTHSVYNNHRIGIRPWGDNQSSDSFAWRECVYD